MTQQTERYEDKGSFSADGKEWKALVQSQGEGEYRTAFATVAASDRSAVYQLHPMLIQENGDVETFKIKRIDPKGAGSFVPADSIPEQALDKLVEITNKDRLHGAAGFYTDTSGRDTARIHFSHTIEVDGKKWNIAELTEKGTTTPVPAVASEGNYGTELRTLMPTQIGDNGKISESKLFNFRNAEWKEAAKDSIPARVVEELERFGNRFKHFGEQGKVYEERLDQRVSSIIDGSDIDAGLAKILKEHHEKKLDDALDKGDFDTAKSAAKEASSHREAAEKLGKPKTHLERVKYEREQQLKVAENGDIERFSR